MSNKRAAAEPTRSEVHRYRLANTYIGSYLTLTRQPVYSLLFLTPLLVVYEAYAYFINFNKPFQIRNGADILLKRFFQLLGLEGLFSMMMFILVAILVIVGISYRRMRQPLVGRYFPLMLGEAIVYSFFLGPVVQRLTGFVQHPFLGPDTSPIQDFSVKLLVSLGAGVYEEIVFRVVLITAMMFLLEKVARFEFNHAAVLSIIASSIIFSGFHYIGEYHWQFTWESFLYRAIAGLVLAILYITRGLGITAWTHSLYDVYVLLVTGT